FRVSEKGGAFMSDAERAVQDGESVSSTGVLDWNEAEDLVRLRGLSMVLASREQVLRSRTERRERLRASLEQERAHAYPSASHIALLESQLADVEAEVAKSERDVATARAEIDQLSARD
ncbi:MAG: hypothetical protein ABWZ87_05490, partial [Aeromicrobium sp.]